MAAAKRAAKLPKLPKVPTQLQVDRAIKRQAKAWHNHSGYSTNSWVTQIVSSMKLGNAPDAIYTETRKLIDESLKKTNYLESFNVCGSKAIAVKPGTKF